MNAKYLIVKQLGLNLHEINRNLTIRIVGGMNKNDQRCTMYGSIYTSNETKNSSIYFKLVQSELTKNLEHVHKLLIPLTLLSEPGLCPCDYVFVNVMCFDN